MKGFNTYDSIINTSINDILSREYLDLFIDNIVRFGTNNRTKKYFLTSKQDNTYYLDENDIDKSKISLMSNGKLLMNNQRLLLMVIKYQWIRSNNMVLDYDIRLAYILFYSILKDLIIDVRKIIKLSFDKSFITSFFNYLNNEFKSFATKG